MSTPLTRTAASAAVEDIGWRHLLGTLATSVAVDSLARGASVAAEIAAACGDDAEAHLTMDLRPDRVELTLMDRSIAGTTMRDVELARIVTDVVRTQGLETGGVSTTSSSGRPVQQIEFAVDAMDIPAVRPFWKAVFAYVDERGDGAPDDGLVDPARQGPAMWFQQMSEPREPRNRIHFDISVAHDEAEARVAAAIEAGGHLVSDAEARAFWLLADREGNEVCVCTWQDRDPE